VELGLADENDDRRRAMRPGRMEKYADRYL
jgi:hypothetical protein